MFNVYVSYFLRDSNMNSNALILSYKHEIMTKSWETVKLGKKVILVCLMFTKVYTYTFLYNSVPTYYTKTPFKCNIQNATTEK